MRTTEEEKFGISLLTNAIGLRHDPIAELFEMSVGRIFLKHVRSLPPYTGRRTFEALQWRWVSLAQEYLETNANNITHICDWLTTAHFEAHPWLLRPDDLGRPLKLMKCGSLERLVHEANKAESRLHQKGLPHFMALTSHDEVFVTDLGAGYTLVQLLSPDALDVESDRMRHCIGHGAYDENLILGGFRYYSVRDEYGAARATLEIVPRVVDGVVYGQLKQFRGRRNAAPEPHVADLIAGVMDGMRWIEKPQTKSAVATDEDLAAAFFFGTNLR